MKLITLRQLRARLGGRCRNAIFADVVSGALPAPIKLGKGLSAQNYWDEDAVDAALHKLRASQRRWGAHS